MLVNIQALVLDAGWHSETVKLLDAKEEKEATGGCPEVDDENAEALCSEETPAVAVESAVARGEQTRHYSAEDAADAVDT